MANKKMVFLNNKWEQKVVWKKILTQQKKLSFRKIAEIP